MSSDFIEHADLDSAPVSPTSELPRGYSREDEFVEDVRAESAASQNPDFVEHADDFSDDIDSEIGPHVTEQPPIRPSMSRRSTIMLDEDERHIPGEEEGPFSRAQEGEQVEPDESSKQPKEVLVEAVIQWKEGGHSVFVTGSFTGWRQMIPLKQFEDGVFAVALKLAPGTHRLRFVVDGELRCSNYMNTATDSMGNLVNYMEVGEADQQPQIPSIPGSMDNLPSHTNYEEIEEAAPAEYTREIPEIFADPEAVDRFSSIDFMPPPQLPPHLDGVILNTNWTDKDNNSVLPIPNHVVLNHLATTSIKHNVLAVASVSRYKAKYVTQILYSPIAGI